MWTPGTSGNLKGRPKKQVRISVPATVNSDGNAYRDFDPSLLTQPHEKQADDLRQGAYHIAKRYELKIHHELDTDAKNTWDSIKAWGTAADKVLASADTVGITLHIPLLLLEKFLKPVHTAISGAPATPQVDNAQGKETVEILSDKETS